MKKKGFVIGGLIILAGAAGELEAVISMYLFIKKIMGILQRLLVKLHM